MRKSCPKTLYVLSKIAIEKTICGLEAGNRLAELMEGRQPYLFDRSRLRQNQASIDGYLISCRVDHQTGWAHVLHIRVLQT